MTDLEKIIDHYGEEAQLNQVTEELGELVTALARWRNRPIESLPNLLEEIADVENVIAQLKLILFEKHPVGAIYNMINIIKSDKIARTLTRIENEKQD